MKQTREHIYCDICHNEIIRDIHIADAMINDAFSGYQIWPVENNEKHICGHCCSIISSANSMKLIDCTNEIVMMYNQAGYDVIEETDKTIIIKRGMRKKYIKK